MLSIGAIAAKVFGSSNDRRLKVYRPNVEAINDLEPELERLTDAELRARTEAFRKQLADGAKLDDLLVPAFATVREAAKRTLGQRHFDVQLIGGMVLHEGKIAEMKTGEGKTLVATLPVYLNALAGRGVHVVTVNDYLAKRDAEWMGRIYKFLGLSVGCIVHELDDDQRKAEYGCDVTYGTNNELGFDYLRDNMKMRAQEMVQRGHAYAIVDEVDSILIDEARTPLIISGPVEDRAELYVAVDELMQTLVADHDKIERELERAHGKEQLKELLKTQGLLELDEKQRQVSFTEAGNEHMEQLLQQRGLLKEGTSFYDIDNVTVVHHASQALKAHKLFLRDRDYIVKANQVIIIDEFTGRMMQGRRYSEGLHQALEAKEKVEIQPENVTLASITFQNYFRLYQKLAGMTGTALTEANEFLDIYRLDVLEIPTNRPMIRIDEHDEVYRTAKEKSRAIVAEIADCHRRGQPVLVGTVSIEKSETLSELLKDHKYIRELGEYLKKQADGIKKGKEEELKAQLIEVGDYLVDLARKNRGDPIPHQVLNARYHEQEAEIIAQAGVPGTVTIATNMAGRGTDIQLGGNSLSLILDWIKEERRLNQEKRKTELFPLADSARRNRLEEEKRKPESERRTLIEAQKKFQDEKAHVEDEIRATEEELRTARPERNTLEPDAKKRPDDARSATAEARGAELKALTAKTAELRKRAEALDEHIANHATRIEELDVLIKTLADKIRPYDDLRGWLDRRLGAWSQLNFEPLPPNEKIERTAVPFLRINGRSNVFSKGAQAEIVSDAVQAGEVDAGSGAAIALPDSLAEAIVNLWIQHEAEAGRSPDWSLIAKKRVETAKKFAEVDRRFAELEARRLGISEALDRPSAPTMDREVVRILVGDAIQDLIGDSQRDDSYERLLEWAGARIASWKSFYECVERDPGDAIQLPPSFIDASVEAWVADERAEGPEPSPNEIADYRVKAAQGFLKIDLEAAGIGARCAEQKRRALAAGGLYVLGTERHESRRIDNQLRGRSGRQGDPGRSKFYLSLEDDLMRIFGSDRMDGMLQKLGLQEGEAITHPWINKALEKAQQKVEARNFDSRKYVLKYDDVMNDQRKVIYEQRVDIMGHDDVSETVGDLRQQAVQELIAECIPPSAYAEQWNTTKLKEDVNRIFGLDLPVDAWAAEEGIAEEEITERLLKAIDEKVKSKEAEFGSETMRQIEKMVLLQTLDHLWREHLITLEHLRQVIGFRSYGQRDPLNEYKSEGFHLFEAMLSNLREAVTGQLMHIQGMPQEDEEAMQPVELPPMQAHHIDPFTGEDELAMADAALAAADTRGDPRAAERRAPVQTRKSSGAVDPKNPATWGKVARNALCPCGSGKKYKHCHGKHD